MKKLGIHSRLLLAVFLLVSATTFLLGYMGVSVSRQFMVSRFEERIAFLARNLAVNAELGILIDDRAMLKRLAENLLAEKDMVAVAISDREGELLTDVANDIGGALNVIEMPVLMQASGEESLAFQWYNDADTQNLRIGTVHLTYTTAGISELLNAMKLRFVWIGIELAALFLLIFFFFSRSLVAPVTQLAHAARRVARGDRELRVKPGRLPETSELALAFNAMLDSLEWSSKALEEAYQEMVQQKTLAEMGKFSMIVAHEVKNPLSIIKTSLDILKKELPAEGDNTLVNYMEDEIQRLNRLIEDFLAFSHPIRPMFRSVDLNALMLEIVERFELQKADKQVNIRTEIANTSFFSNADPDLLVRAVDNVLKNAFEACGECGMVRVSTGCRDRLWYLRIEDEGDGIKSEDLERIFEPFFSKRSKGTGLGLAYAAQVISAHAGRIWAENRSPKGAAFEVEIPIREES